MNSIRACATRLGVLVAAVGALALIAPQVASAQAPKKQYTVALSPSPASAGTTVNETVTFTNSSSSNQGIGSVQVVVPSGFTIVSSSTQGATVSADKTTVTCGTSAGTCAFAQGAGTVSSIAPGSSGSIEVTVTTPVICGSYNWTVRAHQSNDFNGGGNILNPDPTTVPLTVNGACVSQLAFTTEPHSVKDPTAGLPSDVITGTDYDPSGPPVQVQLEDAGGNPITASNVPVTITVKNNPGLADLGGTTTENTVNGVATFSNLTLDELGVGYTLKAATGSVSTISTGFNVENDGTVCAINTSCQVSTGNSASFAQVVSNGGPSGGTLFESVNDGNPLVCPRYTTLDPNTFDVGMTGSVISSGSTWTETIIDVASTQSAAANVKASVQICFGDTKQFINNKNKPAAAATLPDGTQGFVDLLPNCPQTNEPCHDRSADSSQPDPNGTGFDLIVVAQIPPGFDFYSHN